MRYDGAVSDELFQTYDEAGAPGSLVPRARVHREGLWHRAANVLLFRPDGALVLQRRAAGKDVCPGRWDLSAAEHLKPGEDFLDAARRGLVEELGIRDVELSPAGPPRSEVFEAPGVLDRELQQTFRGVSAAPVCADPGEVADVREITLEALSSEMTSLPETFTPWFLHVARACRLLR